MPWQVVVTLVIIGIIVVISGIVAGIATSRWVILVGMMAVYIGYIASGLTTVQQDEVAAYLVFGKAVANLKPGLKLAPPLLTRVVRFTSATIHFMFGAQTDREGKVVTTSPVGGEFLVTTNTPMLVSFAGDSDARNMVPLEYGPTGEVSRWETDESWDPKKLEDDPLQRPLTSGPRVAVIVRISGPKHFIRAAGNLDNAFGNVSRIVEGVLTEFAGKNTLRFCMAHAREVVEAIKHRAEWLIGDPDVFNLPDEKRWGVDLKEVKILYWGMSHRLNEAMQGVANAQFDKQSTVQTAQGVAEATLLTGKARNTVAREMHEGKGGEIALQIRGFEAAEKIAKDAKLIITPGAGGIAELTTTGFAVGQAVQKALGGDKEPTEKNDASNPSADKSNKGSKPDKPHGKEGGGK